MAEVKEPVKPTLDAKVIAKLASTLASGIKAARNSGNALADFCAAAKGGEPWRLVTKVGC